MEKIRRGMKPQLRSVEFILQGFVNTQRCKQNGQSSILVTAWWRQAGWVYSALRVEEEGVGSKKEGLEWQFSALLFSALPLSDLKLDATPSALQLRRPQSGPHTNPSGTLCTAWVNRSTLLPQHSHFPASVSSPEPIPPPGVPSPGPPPGNIVTHPPRQAQISPAAKCCSLVRQPAWPCSSGRQDLLTDCTETLRPVS